MAVAHCGVYSIGRAPAVADGDWVARRILLVDDSGAFRRTAAELLVLRGYEVLASARDGRAAIEAASRDCTDGVLLDVNLPDADGLAVARALAAVCPAARIVLTSADVEDVPAAELAGCHAAAFVPKDELAVVDLTRWFGQDGRCRQ
jgi:DNA-binding NarL/FixJ family response regulator